MKTKFLIAALLVFPAWLRAATPEEGKSIFLSRCAACHNVNKQLTGPALAGLHERRSMDWIISFVNSSQSMIKKGDKDAIALFEKFNRVPMPDHSDLTPEHISSVVEYIKTESKPIETKSYNKPIVQRPAYLPLSLQKDWPFFTLYLFAVLLLVLSLVFAVHIKSNELQRKFGAD